MHYSKLVFIGLLSTGMSFHLFAQESTNDVVTDAIEYSSIPESDTPEHRARFQKLKEIKDDLKNVKASDFKVNANAAQPDQVKDPLQPLNRQFYAFNDALDRTIVRPIAVQYTQKTPEQVRGSYRQFRKNLGEPWNAVNQLIQGRPSRAAKTFGRFTINTLTTLGLALSLIHI